MRLDYTLVAYSSAGGVTLLADENANTIFAGGVIPRDKDYNTVNSGLLIFYCILAAIGLVYTGVWFTFELMFRKKKLVFNAQK